MSIKNTLLARLNYVQHPNRFAMGQRKAWVEHQWHPIDPAFTEVLEKTSEFSGRTLNYQYGYLSPEVYTVDLPQATLYGNSGLIQLADGSAFTESAMLPLRLAKSPGYRRLFRAKTLKKAGLHTSIIHLPWCHNNLFHWLFEGLSRLFPLSLDTTPITLMVPQQMAAFQQSLLDAVLRTLPHVTLARVPKNELWKVEEYRHLSFPGQSQSAYLPTPIRDWLKQSVLHGLGITEPTAPTERIFICRERTSIRRITNEKELVAIAKNYGVTPYFAEDHSYEDQVKQFNRSSLVVGGHGAGLSNALFCQQAAVLEMFSTEVVKSHYALLSMGSGFKYRSLFGTPEKGYDFSISVKEFETALQALID